MNELDSRISADSPSPETKKQKYIYRISADSPSPEQKQTKNISRISADSPSPEQINMNNIHQFDGVLESKHIIIVIMHIRHSTIIEHII